MSVLFGKVDLCGDRVFSGVFVCDDPAAVFCGSGIVERAAGFWGFTGADRVAAVFHVVHDGNAGVLGAGGFDVYFYFIRAGVCGGRASVSDRYFAGRGGAGVAVHAVSVSTVFPGQYLFRESGRGGIVAGDGNPTFLGGVFSGGWQVGLEPGNPEIYRCGRVKRICVRKILAEWLPISNLRRGLSDGVTVAQGPLEAFVMVRIHVGQPISAKLRCPYSLQSNLRGKRERLFFSRFQPPNKKFARSGTIMA